MKPTKKDETKQECKAHALTRMHRIQVPKQCSCKQSQPLELIHSHVCGPMSIDSLGGSMDNKVTRWK